MSIDSIGHNYKWRDPIYKGGARSFEKLDTTLCNDLWKIQFPYAFVKVITRIDFFGHHLILITLKDEERGRTGNVFKFECEWVLEDSYKDMQYVNWNKGGNLISNLEFFIKQVKIWKMYTTKSLQKKKNQLIGKFNGI